MNIPVVSEDNPLRNWADPSREAEEVVPSFAKMHGDHDTTRREELNSKATARQAFFSSFFLSFSNFFLIQIQPLFMSRGEQAQNNYIRLLRRAKTENLSDIAARSLIYQSGTDSFGRAIVCINGKYFNPAEVDKEKVQLYMVLYMDAIASKDYVVVYYNAEATSENHPDLSFVREVYGSLHPKYRRNLRIFYLVHPTWWVKLTVTIMNTFFTRQAPQCFYSHSHVDSSNKMQNSSDIREKMKNIETLSDLFQTVPPQQLNVPDYVLA